MLQAGEESGHCTHPTERSPVKIKGSLTFSLHENIALDIEQLLYRTFHWVLLEQEKY